MAPTPATDLLFVNAAEVVTCRGPAAARRGRAMQELEILRDAAVAVHGTRIVAVGPVNDLSREYAGATQIDCRGGVLAPALVDSHTHAIFGAPRAAEHELRAAGVDY